MAKRTRGPKPTTRSRGPAGPDPRGGEPGEPDLLADIAGALETEHPLAFLGLASALLAALEPAPPTPFGPEPDPETPSREEVVEGLLDADVVETSALLAAIAAFSGDEVLRRRVRRELGRRTHALPRWLAELGRAEPHRRTVEVVHVLRDGDNLLVGAHLPGGAELTAVVYVDHNMGTVVKDAYVVPVGVDDLVEQMLAVADDPDTQARDLDAADARVRITEAIGHGAITYPPLESESWPACRPLVEWLTAMLPPGGREEQRPEWAEAALAALADRFFASALGAAFDGDDGRCLLDSLLWFRTDYGFGDPQLWSPAAVEILLVDWIPRKIVADAPYLAQAPDVLRAFIRFAHDERGIRPALTAEALAAVDEYEPEYQEIIRSPRPQGPEALLAALGVADPADLVLAPSRVMLTEIARAVGGEDALDRLDTAPLPDEEFAWAAIAPDVRDRVGEVLVLVERCCDELLDVECRTACRRFLARAAAADPGIFRRRGRIETAAAAVCWVIGNVNDLFLPSSTPHVLAKDLNGYFGVTSSSQRARAFVDAVGGESDAYHGGVCLGAADYLVSSYRAELIELRDRHRERIG